MKKRYNIVLSIAGSDSSAGAGIQADLKTFAALGCYGLSVVTALTAQNTGGVVSVHPAPPDFISAQLDAVLSDMVPDAVKIGMLYSSDAINAVARILKKYSLDRVILDPVMTGHGGDSLMEEDAVDAVKEMLFPLAAVVTPNLPEASRLVNRPVNNIEDMHEAAISIASYGAKSVLIKGGHMAGNDIRDVLYINTEDRFVVFRAERINTRNNHGTGCTLSSAIAAFMATGHGLEDAVGLARKYLEGAIRAGAGYEIGRGRGPLHHFYKFW